MCAVKKIDRIVPDELEEVLRDVVRNAYLENPAYAWWGEDILEELEDMISDELLECRDRYQSP